MLQGPARQRADCQLSRLHHVMKIASIHIKKCPMLSMREWCVVEQVLGLEVRAQSHSAAHPMHAICPKAFLAAEHLAQLSHSFSAAASASTGTCRAPLIWSWRRIAMAWCLFRDGAISLTRPSIWLADTRPLSDLCRPASLCMKLSTPQPCTAESMLAGCPRMMFCSRSLHFVSAPAHATDTTSSLLV